MIVNPIFFKSIILIFVKIIRTIAILFYLCPRYYGFLGIGLRAMLNGQEFQSLFLVFKLSQPKRELLYG